MCVWGCCVSSGREGSIEGLKKAVRGKQQNKYTIFNVSCVLSLQKNILLHRIRTGTEFFFFFFVFNFLFWNNFIFSQKTKTHTLFFVHNRCNNSSSSSTSCKGVFCSHQKSYSISCIGGEGGAMIMRRAAEKFYNREIFFRDGSKSVFKSIFWQCHLFVI